jgi:hypothetical protein
MRRQDRDEDFNTDQMLKQLSEIMVGKILPEKT